MQKIFFLSLLSLLSRCVIAQENLPRYMTEQERALFPAYLQNLQVSGRSIPSPPSSTGLRTMAEWEEIEAICITWTSYASTLKEIVRYAQEECKVMIICSDSIQVKNYLTSNTVPVGPNVKFIEAPFNSIWFRDYGQNNVYINQVDSLFLVDWVYNRPRASDDALPSYLADYFNLPLYQTIQAPYKLVHTGGNFMADGFGTGFSSNLVQDENTSLNIAQVDGIMEDFMGINNYIRMNTLPYDGIHHIDMHMKLLDEETLLLSEYPSGISDGPQIEANLQYILSNYVSMYGTPYKVARIPVPSNSSGWPSAGGDYLTYTNSVFINKTILVPVYSSGNTAEALQIYKDLLPAGYKVIGINCDNIIQASGALHCITKEIGTKDPLLINHQFLVDTYDTVNAYAVNARILHRSGIKSASLFYRTDSLSAYSEVLMSQGFNPEYWSADIPAQSAGTTVDYYIFAESYSGKKQFRPMTSPDGFHSFDVLLNTSATSLFSANLISRIYPNPSHGITVIELSSGRGLGSIVLRDILGRVVQTIFVGELEKKNYFFNTSSIPAGSYFISIESDGFINSHYALQIN